MARPTHLHAFHRGQVPTDQLADGTATDGYAPVSNGDGSVTWAPAGGGGGVTVAGPFAITSSGSSDVGLDLAEGDIILSAFLATTTAASAPADGDYLNVILYRDAGGSTSLTLYDLFNNSGPDPQGHAYYSVGLVAPYFSTPDQAYIDSPKSAVIRADAAHIGVTANVDSSDGGWDLYVVMQPA